MSDQRSDPPLAAEDSHAAAAAFHAGSVASYYDAARNYLELARRHLHLSNDTQAAGAVALGEQCLTHAAAAGLRARAESCYLGDRDAECIVAAVELAAAAARAEALREELRAVAVLADRLKVERAFHEVCHA